LKIYEEVILEDGTITLSYDSDTLKLDLGIKKVRRIQLDVADVKRLTNILSNVQQVYANEVYMKKRGEGAAEDYHHET